MHHLNAILAALTLYTRLPLWRIKRLDTQAYEEAIRWWPLVGLITGGLMAGVYLLSYPLGTGVASVLAILSRLLLTGAFHEDGLADFFDGFGGGRTKERILAIMKDSHIGSYGTIALIVYYLLLFQLLQSLPLSSFLPMVLIADIGGKYLASWQVWLLPYVRRSDDSKIGVVYRSYALFPLLTQSLLLVGLVWFLGLDQSGLGILLAVFVCSTLIAYIRRRIGGYTGDCCGAIFLMTELAFYLGYLIQSRM